jgi:sugar phosphate isomerase/epimerase
MHRIKHRKDLVVWAAAAALGVSGLLVSPASAATPTVAATDPAQCAGRSVPANKISIQLFSVHGWVQQAGIDTVLGTLAEMGYKNVEPFGGTYGTLDAEEFRALLKKHGLKAPTSHGSTPTDANIDDSIAWANTLGQRYVGSGGFAQPGIQSYEDVLATAQNMNRFGRMSVTTGSGKLFGHNHEWEFTTKYADPRTGELKPVWEILVENTDPRWVTFQLDTLLAVHGGADVVDLLERYGDRIELLHVKDGFPGGAGRPVQTDVGEGALEWGPILEAAQGKVKYYIVERAGGPGEEFARDSFDFLSCTTF